MIKAMIFGLAVAVLALNAPPASAQTTGFHLVIVAGTANGGSGVTSIRYTSLATCLAAARVLEQDWKERYAQARAAQQPGQGILVGPAYTAFGSCVPA